MRLYPDRRHFPTATTGNLDYFLRGPIPLEWLR
jgi:hypothetical protein